MTNQYVQWIAEEAESRGIDPYLALAIAKQESNFDPYLKNHRSIGGRLDAHIPNHKSERTPCGAVQGLHASGAEGAS